MKQLAQKITERVSGKAEDRTKVSQTLVPCSYSVFLFRCLKQGSEPYINHVAFILTNICHGIHNAEPDLGRPK